MSRSRIVITLFLAVLSLGYIAAISNLYLAHHDADLKPELTIEDIKTHFHGDPSLTRLTIMINTDMRQYLETEEEKIAIEEWVAAGASESGYLDIRHIFQNRCIRCHDMFGKAEFAPLTTYDEVTKYTSPAQGVSWGHIARLSHQHFFGMGLLFGAVGYLLLQTGRTKLKSLVTSMAFTAIIADVGGWSLTKLHPDFAWLTAVAGALHGMLFVVMVAWIVFEIWFGSVDESPRGSLQQ